MTEGKTLTSYKIPEIGLWEVLIHGRLVAFLSEKEASVFCQTQRRGTYWECYNPNGVMIASYQDTGVRKLFMEEVTVR